MKQSIQYLSNIFIGVVIFAIGFLLTFTYNAFRDVNQNDKITSGYVSKNAISFEVVNDIPISSIEVSHILYPTCMLFQRQGVQLEDITLFSYSGNTHFELLAGRQFLANDLLKDSELLICGTKREMESDLLKDIEAIKIGTIGIKNPSILDYMKITLPSATERENLHKGTWILDGDRNIQNSYDELSKAVGEKNLRLAIPEKTGAYQMDKNMLLFDELLVVTTLCSFFAYLSLILYWIQCRSLMFSLAALFGANFMKVVFALTKNFLRLLICSLLLGVTCGCVFIWKERYLQIIEIGCLFTGALFIVLCIYFVTLVMWIGTRRRRKLIDYN